MCETLLSTIAKTENFGLSLTPVTGSIRHRMFSAWDIAGGFRVWEFDLSAYMGHIRRKAESTSAVVGFGTASLEALYVLAGAAVRGVCEEPAAGCVSREVGSLWEEQGSCVHMFKRNFRLFLVVTSGHFNLPTHSRRYCASTDPKILRDINKKRSPCLE